MHPHYPALNRDLKVAAAFEKVSAEIDSEFRDEAHLKLALICDEIFQNVVAKAGTKEAGVVDYLLTMRESHLASGEKTAASNDLLADTMLKLATALHVDSVLTAAIGTADGETKFAALNARALGREYSVMLMRNLLS